MARSGSRERVRRTLRRWTAWPRKLADSRHVRALTNLGWLSGVLGGLSWLGIGGPLGLWLLCAAAAFFLAALVTMAWRWMTVGDRLGRELDEDRQAAAEVERNRGINRLQDRLARLNDPRARRVLAGLRDLGARSRSLDAERSKLAPADAEVLLVVERMRAASLETLTRLATLRESPAARGGPGSGDAVAAAEAMVDEVEEAVSRMAVAVSRLETRRLAGPAPAAGAAGGLDSLSAELEGAMTVAQRVEERLAEIDPGSDRRRE